MRNVSEARRAGLWGLSGGAALALVACGVPPDARPRVLVGEGEVAAHALVTARFAEGPARTVYADADGYFTVPTPAHGVRGGGGEAPRSVEIRSSRAEAEPRLVVEPAVDGSLPGELRLGPVPERPDPRASSFLGQLPDGERKRSTIVDCGGCHTFDSIRMRSGGRDRTTAEWTEALALMLGQYGPGTGFPIVSAQRDATHDAAWLTESLTGAPWPTDPAWPAETLAGTGTAVLTEWDMPEPLDLAHDVAVHPSGEILVTGMFTHLVYVLDPYDGSFRTVAIPVPNANPRAIDVGPDGRWWVLLGAAGGIASYDPAADEWTSWEIGMYPHSIALGSDGRIWSNGHFTFAPEVIAAVDPDTDDIQRFTVPADPADTESTIPYGLRVSPTDGSIWATQLRGNRLVRLDPATGESRAYEMPTSASGPRRPDVGPDGSVWIPEFGANRLARFDPDTESFEELDFPAPDAAPYVARVDQRRGTVWIGTGQGDVVGAYDPASRRFTLYPLPTRGALVRHLDIDEETGAVWATYSASPGIGGKLLRIEP